MHPSGTGVVLTDYLTAIPLSSILHIDCRAVDGFIASALVTKIVCHRQLHSPGVKLFYLVSHDLSLISLIGKQTGHTFHRLALPRADLRWVEVPFSGNFLNRLVSTQCFARNCRFKLG